MVHSVYTLSFPTSILGMSTNDINHTRTQHNHTRRVNTIPYWPTSPVEGFSAPDLERMKTAWADAIAMASDVQKNVNRYDPIFKKYFRISNDDEIDFVLKVFQRISPRAANQIAANPQPGSEKEVVTLKDLVMWCSPLRDGYDDRCGKTVDIKGVRSYLAMYLLEVGDTIAGPKPVYIPSGRALMVVCPANFAGPAWVPLNSEVHCADLPSQIVEEMKTLSHILIHEWTHFTQLVNPQGTPGKNGIDDLWAEEKHNGRWIPESPYGVFNSQLLVTTSDPNRNPVKNADNYAWFALEVYFTQQCGRGFLHALPPPVSMQPLPR